ncbi:DMT family transporter [Aquabacterium sp. A7-Y]|uniref:DMT family transporter n=1 Tax=Aquabacterium sp. A7-Y TaxID=1349605 RepID=UPI00223E5CA2|nr:DMT family transporter [Aquabacterium sp. A7-Y]MCW7541601.1 DMT family transporter [Aquabacterium sp. A7-Y]
MQSRQSGLVQAMPWVFVLIWSTGFIVARYGMPYAPPLKFLALRFAFSIACFLPWIVLARAAWPRGTRQWAHLGVTGVLLHAGYLAGVWAAVKAGMGAGTIALIVGLQPVLTAVWLAARGGSDTRASARQWLGLALGFAGLALVVGRKLGVGELNRLNLGLAVFALLSITVGTLYQKRHVASCDVRTANTVQLLAALGVSLPLTLLEPEAIVAHPHFIGAMAWSVLGLTLGGSSLYYLLIQRGAATRVTSLLYLVPPCTAVMAWILFDETLAHTTLLGMALAALGVWLVVKSAAAPVSARAG